MSSETKKKTYWWEEEVPWDDVIDKSLEALKARNEAAAAAKQNQEEDSDTSSSSSDSSDGFIEVPCLEGAEASANPIPQDLLELITGLDNCSIDELEEKMARTGADSDGGAAGASAQKEDPEGDGNAGEIRRAGFEFASQKSDYFYLVAERMFRKVDEFEEKRDSIRQSLPPDARAPKPRSSEENVKLARLRIQNALIRKILALLHVKDCKDGKEGHFPCALYYCKVVKQRFEHIRSCKVPGECQVDFCDTSRAVLRHYYTCKQDICPICGAVMNVERLSMREGRLFVV